MPQTKFRQRFDLRILQFQTDLELAHGLVHSFIELTESDANATLADATGVDGHYYQKLASRSNTKNSRKVIARHLARTAEVSFIKDLYEEFTEYLRDVLGSAARQNLHPARFVGEYPIRIGAAELLKLGSWDAVIKHVSGEVFRSLENERNTRTLIEKASRRLGFATGNAELLAAMPYLEMRHLFVHHDGRADAQYAAAYPTMALRNGKVALDLNLCRDAAQYVLALVDHIDTNVTPLCHVSDIAPG